MKEFTNKVVAITGGSSGIGLSIAQKFHSQTAKVAVLGREQKKLDKIENTSKGILTIKGDVSKIADLDRFYQTIDKTFGKIDVLIASAGIAPSKILADVDEQFFDNIVNINYKGLFFSVQRALSFLNQGASVILISSAAAHLGWPGHSVYSSTKAAVSYLARGFSADLVNRGIRVNAISPGFVDTPLFDEIKTSTPETMKKLNNTIPAKRFAKSEEIAEAALFLASSQSSYMIGSDLIIDGGISAIYPVNL